MKAGIIVAMQSEFDALKSSGVTDVVKAGIGKVNAARAATELILTDKPDFVINSGVAGSLREDIRTFDVVFGSETAYHDVWCGEGSDFGQVEDLPQRFAADPYLLSVARSLSSPRQHHEGLLITGDQFFISLEEDDRQRRLYPDALACDMESAAIAQVCHLYGVPFLSFRVISDVHTSGEVQKTSYKGFWKDLADDSFNVLKQLVEKI